MRLSDNRCVRRTYAYDGGGAGDSNRTSTSVWTSSPGAACGSGTPTTRTLSYDTADRINSTGWTWDSFGRATAAPAADSGGTGALAASYYVNDRVRQLTLDGRTQTYTRDPLDRTKTIESTGASKPTLTSTYRYSDDTDEPAKITLSDSSTIHDVQGPSGQVVATNDSGTLTYELRDLQGSIVGVAPAGGTPTATTEYDPFGIVTTSTPNVINWTKGLPANGWLGSHQRPTAFGQTGVDAAGPIEMGARVYLPKIGRFLQVDPVDGGSANAYDYAYQDPTNLQDLTGMCVLKLPCPKIIKSAVHAAGSAAGLAFRYGRYIFGGPGSTLLKTAQYLIFTAPGASKAVKFVGKAGVLWAACFGWKYSAATQYGQHLTFKQVGRLALQCTGLGFVLDPAPSPQNGG